MPKLLMTIIKIISTILIVGALGLVAHFLEGIVAFVYAPSRKQSAIASALYTFFVGTVGLVELFELQGVEQE